MISKLSNNCCDKEEKPFPKLMISTSGTIVFFEKSKIGMVVYGSVYSKIAEYSEDWGMGLFKDYEGDVCLSNS